MALNDNFPSNELLTKEGYETVEEVQEATDEELLAIDGIGPARLDEIRAVAPFKESADSTGTGATSGTKGPDHSIEPTSQSFQTQTSKVSKDRTDPITGQELPEGIVKNERGTLTASSTVDQEDMVSPEQVKREREAQLRNAGEKISALLGG